MFHRIAEFHHAFGHTVAEAPCLPDQATRDLRIALLNEELEEFCKANGEGDRVGMADGLADMAVIICGTMLVYGIAPDDREFDSPYDDDLVPYPDDPSNTACASWLVSQFSQYVLAEQSNDIGAIRSCLMNLLMDVCGSAFVLRIPLNAAFAEVHRSNMSKLMPDGSVLYREDHKILKGPNYVPPDIAAVLAKYDV